MASNDARFRGGKLWPSPRGRQEGDLMSGEPLDDAFLKRLAELVVASAGAPE
jgi:hypothetical protein